MVLEHEEVLDSQSFENEFFNKQYGIAMKMIKHSAMLPMNNNAFFKGKTPPFLLLLQRTNRNKECSFFDKDMKLMDF